MVAVICTIVPPKAVLIRATESSEAESQRDADTTLPEEEAKAPDSGEPAGEGEFEGEQTAALPPDAPYSLAAPATSRSDSKVLRSLQDDRGQGGPFRPPRI